MVHCELCRPPYPSDSGELASSGLLMSLDELLPVPELVTDSNESKAAPGAGMQQAGE